MRLHTVSYRTESRASPFNRIPFSLLRLSSVLFLYISPWLNRVIEISIPRSNAGTWCNPDDVLVANVFFEIKEPCGRRLISYALGWLTKSKDEPTLFAYVESSTIIIPIFFPMRVPLRT